VELADITDCPFEEKDPKKEGAISRSEFRPSLFFRLSSHRSNDAIPRQLGPITVKKGDVNDEGSKDAIQPLRANSRYHR
jgi:hypothetical protein